MQRPPFAILRYAAPPPRKGRRPARRWPAFGSVRAIAAAPAQPVFCGRADRSCPRCLGSGVELVAYGASGYWGVCVCVRCVDLEATA